MGESEASQRPRNAIVILLDSLNRHMLGAYGGTEFETPNVDRFASRSLRFDRHYAGSLPCMPARLDFMPGSRVPVIRQPFQAGDRVPYWAMDCKPDDHALFDLRQDPGERRNLAGAPLEKRAVDRLRAALDEVEAPAEQYQRLGIA